MRVSIAQASFSSLLLANVPNRGLQMTKRGEEVDGASKQSHKVRFEGRSTVYRKLGRFCLSLMFHGEKNEQSYHLTTGYNHFVLLLTTKQTAAFRSKWETQKKQISLSSKQEAAMSNPELSAENSL